MNDPIYTEADLAPERQLQHIKNLQSQVESLYDLNTRLAERVEELETAKKLELIESMVIER